MFVVFIFGAFSVLFLVFWLLRSFISAGWFYRSHVFICCSCLSDLKSKSINLKSFIFAFVPETLPLQQDRADYMVGLLASAIPNGIAGVTVKGVQAMSYRGFQGM